MSKKVIAYLLSIFAISSAIAATTDTSQPIDDQKSKYSPEEIRRLESNAFRRVFPNESYLADRAPLSTQDQEKMAQQAIQDLAVKEGEALTDSEKRAVAKKSFDNKVNEALNIDAIKTSFFNGFRVSETFTHAMLNSQQDTGDPLFMLQARQQGILEDDYIYLGSRVSLIDWQRLNRVPPGGENKQFSYKVYKTRLGLTRV